MTGWWINKSKNRDRTMNDTGILDNCKNSVMSKRVKLGMAISLIRYNEELWKIADFFFAIWPYFTV